MTPASSTRSVARLATTTPRPGTGILRPFPSETLPTGIDPFVFLDTGAPVRWGTRTIVVPPHAHRGVSPVSLLFRGRISHRDSLGHAATVESGGMQWLASGSGALHEEVLAADEEGVFHMAQLWIDVPAARKADPPEHRALPAEAIPVLEDLAPGVRLRLYAGELAGQTGPAPMASPILLAHVTLDAGARVELPVPAGWNAAFTVVAGRAGTAGATDLAPGATPVFARDGETVAVSSEAGAQVLFMAGQPLDEPVVFGGGFVLRSKAEVAQAFADLEAGRMGRLAPSTR